ncbi:hypothetical protein C1645_746054 [Glomus cerebriforme]|uniref:Uncharacterized protein n=1 Tax=Glomus cerebriforme TaxID=658196 RepID=A0A397S913_9GLOM|nr:hypothetical protein C1645_746054 [Glomus cerebriforme]
MPEFICYYYSPGFVVIWIAVVALPHQVLQSANCWYHNHNHYSQKRSQNSTFYPKSGSDADCDDGLYCCGVCSNFDSPGCSCCSDVHRACQMECDKCYNVGLNVEYYVGK